MTKEFIPYEQALALKELGFDEVTLMWRYGDKQEKLYLGSGPQDEGDIPTPLYQQAFRWFREKHNLVFNFISYNIVKPGEYHWSITWNDEAKAGGIVKTYEEAELECLKKLIEIVKAKS